MKINTSNWTRLGVGMFAGLAILATSVAPVQAHQTRRHHHHHHHVVKPKVKVNINVGAPRPVYYAPAPVVYVNAPPPRCYRARHSGWFHGHPAVVSHRYCYNAWGNAVVQDGSKRLVRYY
jgi:hypothetical protein